MMTKGKVSSKAGDSRGFASMQPPVDFVIVAPLNEELNALLSKFGRTQRLSPSTESAYVYYSMYFPILFPDGSESAYKIILTQPVGMGRVAAANITGEAIRQWQPRFVLVVGIAGGVATAGVNLGDILIPDQIADFEHQKITSKQPEVRWKVFQTDTALLNAARRMEGRDWACFIEVKRPQRGSPRACTGTVCTGDKVVANELMNTYRGVWPELIGVEMEGGGVASTAFQARPAPGFFMIRGVSDLADQNKDQPQVKQWRSYACDVAAAFTVGLLRSAPVSEALRSGRTDVTPSSPLNQNEKSIIKRPRHSLLTASVQREGRAIRMAISKALSLLADDRFGSEHGTEKKGGWALSYASQFLPLAFPDTIPGSCAPNDSITVTHWIVRGLYCLRELECSTGCLTSADSKLLAHLLADAKVYLDRHYRDGKGGMLRVSSQAELKFLPDVRHSAALAKALLYYPGGDHMKIRSLFAYVLKHALSREKYDLRLSTHAEILAALDLLQTNPDLCGPRMKPLLIEKARQKHEAELLTLCTPVMKMRRKHTDRPKYVESLFNDPAAASHMAPYYTWWALDCYGERLKNGKAKESRSIFVSATAGLRGFEKRIGDTESGFPLNAAGPPNPGATAQIANVFAKHSWNEESPLVSRCLRYVTNCLCDDAENVASYPFALWAFFCLTKQCHERRTISL